MASIRLGCRVRTVGKGGARALRVRSRTRYHCPRRSTTLLFIRGRRVTAELHYLIQRKTLQVRYRPNPRGNQTLFAGGSEARAPNINPTSVRDAYASPPSSSLSSHPKGATASQSRSLRSRRAVRVREDPLGATDKQVHRRRRRVLHPRVRRHPGREPARVEPRRPEGDLKLCLPRDLQVQVLLLVVKRQPVRPSRCSRRRCVLKPGDARTAADRQLVYHRRDLLMLWQRGRAQPNAAERATIARRSSFLNSDIITTTPKYENTIVEL